MTNSTNQIPDTVDEKSTKDILSVVLSFIGLGRSTQNDDSNRSLYSSSFSSSSTKVASTSSSSTRSSSYSTCDELDQSTLYHTEGTISSPEIKDGSTIFVPSTITSSSSSSTSTTTTPLYETWAFQDWLQRLPKLALFHLVSTTAMQDPMVAYYLLEYQYNNDNNNNINDNNNTNTIYGMNNNTIDTTTIAFMKEIKWIQHHSRAILHQLDHLRPNEQFAEVKNISDQIHSLLQLCEQHFYDHLGDSWLTIMSFILITQECFDDTPLEIRQYLFYHVKIGRTIILKMNATLKHYKLWKKHHHTTPQQYVANSLFPTNNNNNGWRDALESMCQHLARLDDGWKFKDEYQKTITLANHIIP